MDFAPALAAVQEGGLPVYNKSAAAVVTAQLARRVTVRAHVVACRAKARVTSDTDLSRASKGGFPGGGAG